MTTNLARDYLKESNQSLKDYDGYCLELCDDILHWLDRADAKILHLEVPNRIGRLYGKHIWDGGWCFHSVIFVNNLVHDAHLPEPMPLPKYLREMFVNDHIQVTYFLPEKEELWVRKERSNEDFDLSR